MLYRLLLVIALFLKVACSFKSPSIETAVYFLEKSPFILNAQCMADNRSVLTPRRKGSIEEPSSMRESGNRVLVISTIVGRKSLVLTW